MVMNMSEKFEILFEYEKDTKNMYRFKEIIPEGELRAEIMRNIYISKRIFGKKKPKKVKVILEILE